MTAGLKQTVFLFVIACGIAGCGVSAHSSPVAQLGTPTGDAILTAAATVTPEPVPTQTSMPENIPDWQQVWSDEFSGPEIDRAKWEFGTGTINDCLHYFTDRPENAKVKDGILQIIALEEPYHNADYTAALLKAKPPMGWRYGRMEARIKLPGTNGFVPAFWMLPADDQYGWWPYSGEIDILEHPSNQISKIYGTVHTGRYNAFTGSSPRGGVIDIADAESAFHVYAIEWAEDVIDFYVDDKNYFSFSNEQQGTAEWPFDQPFNIILSMGVGGGWVGKPDDTSVFPAVMEVDYVRVYQNLGDVSIHGPDYVVADSAGVSYAAPEIDGLIYSWSVTGGARIVSGQGSPGITVDWGNQDGVIELELARANGNIHVKYPVTVSGNLLKNGGFEKGAKYWRTSGLFPNTSFLLAPDGIHAGAYGVSVNITNPVANPWEIQLSQGDIPLRSGNRYRVGVWAKAEGINPKISLAVIHPTDFTLYGNKVLQLSNAWTHYEMTFDFPADVSASLNIDMGDSAGKIHLDDIELIML
jgi:beta-glucanase (GH16 family)